MLRNTILIFVFLLISYAVKALEVDNIEFEVNKLSENVYVVSKPSGETFLNFGVVIGEDGVVLISSMMPDYAPTTEKLVERLTGSKIKYVINIDPDYYHHYSNEYFSAKGATIIAQNNVKNINKFVDIGYEEKISIDVGTEVIELVHTSARNPGDSAIFLKNSNVIFLGDTLRNDWLAYSNESGYKGHLEALGLILAIGNENTKFIPGNRRAVVYSNARDVSKAIKLHLNFAKEVKTLLMQGLSVEDIAKNEEVLKIVEGLESYDEFKEYLTDHIKGVIHSI
jgi:glyoxylase-like metal-dependent hydrolase (beta-lactamase superfamily II)